MSASEKCASSLEFVSMRNEHHLFNWSLQKLNVTVFSVPVSSQRLFLLLSSLAVLVLFCFPGLYKCIFASHFYVSLHRPICLQRSSPVHRHVISRYHFVIISIRWHPVIFHIYWFMYGSSSSLILSPSPLCTAISDVQ